MMNIWPLPAEIRLDLVLKKDHIRFRLDLSLKISLANPDLDLKKRSFRKTTVRASWISAGNGQIKPDFWIRYTTSFE